LPQSYQLGTKAYAKAPPAWWLKLVGEATISDKWHPKDFPLAYAGEFKSKSGRNVLLVVQVSHAFSGDGILSRGPELYLIARMFSIEDAGLKLAKEQAFRLGSMQYARLLAGKADGRQIEFRTEGGTEFDGHTTTWKRNWTLSVGEDNSLSIKKGE